jgi:hypothetical protein
MKKSRFIESHIAAVLKKQESGVSVKIFAAIQELVIKSSIHGRQNMTVWILPSLRRLNNLKRKIAGLSVCMPS